MYNVKQVSVPGERKKMLYLLVLLVLLVVIDGVITIFLVKNGIATEGNPFLRPIIGEVGFMVLKVVGAVAVSIYAWLRFSRLALVGAWIGVVGYSVIVLWNTSLFLLT
jgi:hypothetical protein